MKKKLILSIALSACMAFNTAAVFAETTSDKNTTGQTQSEKKQETKSDSKNNTSDSKNESDKTSSDEKYSSEDVLGETKNELEGGYSVIGAKESNYANLINDALLENTGADISLTSAGTILKSIKSGTIKYEDVSSSIMFGTIVMTKELTGKQIKNILEQGAEIYPESNSKFVHPGKLSYTIDPNRKSGERITSVKVSGKSMDMSKKYTVAVNDYMLSEYTDLYNAKTVKDYSSLDTIIADFIKEKKVVNYKTDGRIKAEKLQTVDEQKIKDLISEIDKLTYDKTDSNIKKVNEAVKKYNELSETEKKKITNASRLKDIVSKLNSSGSNITKPSSGTTSSSTSSSTSKATQSSPKTGDPSIALPAAVFLLSGAGLFAIRRKQ